VKFTHLHVHSHYSLLDGLPKIDQFLNYLKEQNMDSMAITDHGNIYGAVEFYEKATEKGIKPIIGCEMYVALEKMFDKRPNIDDRRHHLVLLVKDKEGYKNLVKLITRAHLEGFYYKPRIDEELLAKHSKGLICLSACIMGKIPRLILAKKTDEAEKTALKYQQIFGKDNFYLEIQHHPNFPDQEIVNKGLISISRKLNIPLVATNDVHYLKPEDAEAQDTLMLINTGSDRDNRERKTLKADDFSMKTPEQMSKDFKKFPEAIENTQKIAKLCNFKFELGKTRLPVFKVPEEKTPEDYLEKLCYKGLKEKFGEYPKKEIIERLNYELSTIKQAGFASYFLIVQDFVNWAKKNRIVVGPGRGSVGGSLAAYLLKITNIDPLKHNLLFERFLNPGRSAGLPDIDLDFTDRRRDEVINYVAEKYGKDKVAQIITFGTMAARAVIRDVGRAMKYTYSYCDQIAKMIPFGMTLDETMKKVIEFRSLYESDEQAKKLIDIAKKLEGVARHASTHACGVVISNNPLDEIVPLQHPTQNDQTIVTQYEMRSIEKLGILKMDFLGLKNLTIIEDTLSRIYSIYKKNLDIENIPFDDKQAYKLLQKSKTVGVFQLECLSGDTIISNTTIKKLFERKNRKRLASLYLDKGKIHLNEIIDVVESGEKEIYSLIGKNNWYIKSTKGHCFLTKQGWKKLEEIKAGDEVLIRNKAKHLIYNTCQKCEKQISGQKEGKSNFCYQCSAKFYRNPSKKQSRQKISEAKIKFHQQGGKPWNHGLNAKNSFKIAEIGRKISKALIGKTFEDHYGKEKAEKIKRAMSTRNRGENNPMFGKPCPHRKGGFREDLNHYVRSSWEADFARILKLHNLNYQYEPKTFKLQRASKEILHYTPDFYVPSQNTFYEIKGFIRDLDQEKLELFQDQYPHINLIIINTTRFAEFALKYRTLVNWECPKIPEKGFSFIKIKAIKFAGKEKTYDIKMKSPGNNFQANGFIVHNSGGMQRYLKQLKPTDFEDIIAMVALYRPGPMQLIPDYIARKQEKQKIEYFHPKLKPILEKTYGFPVYQEQIMQIARDMAGFSLSEADVLRKAIGKKIKKLLMSQKEKFIKGCKKNNVNENIAQQIWHWIEPFASYSFNRCVSSDTQIINGQTGEVSTIEEIYKDKKNLPSVLSCKENLKLKKSKTKKIFFNGIKPVYEITTQLGRKIKVTLNHPFLTIKGWQMLSHLKKDERIAVPRILPIKNKKAFPVKNHQLIILGYLLAEGNLCHPYGFYFYSKNKREREDYLKSLEKFKNTKGKIDMKRLNAPSIYTGRINIKRKSEAVEWIESIGLKYKKAIQKEFPCFVFKLNKRQLSLVLAKLFQGDGCINIKRKHPQIFYATSSYKLATQLQHLLLRLGIISKLNYKIFKYPNVVKGQEESEALSAYGNGIKKGYTLTITRYENIKNFIDTLGKYLIGNKKTAIKQILKTHPILTNHLPQNAARGSKDIIPVEVKKLITAEIKKKGFSLKSFAKKHKIAQRLLFRDKKKKGYLRETLEKIGKIINSQLILNYARSDIYWDKITSIKYLGKKPTFDLNINPSHNYVANDIIVHNSHAAAYATIAYQTAFLKIHYPAEFMSSLLTSERNDVERIGYLIDDCKKMELEVLPPDINESFTFFSVVPKKNQIRFGLSAIKNVGFNIVEIIVNERKTNGFYSSIDDFVSRINSRDLNKKSIESLIKAGVFDKMAERNQLLSNMEKLLEYSKEKQKAKTNGQIGLFDEITSGNNNNQINLTVATPASEKEKLVWEKELLGLFISSHPLNSFKKILAQKTVSLLRIQENEFKRHSRLKIGGIISKIKKIITKTGKPMLFIDLEDLNSRIEVVVFPNTIEKNSTVFQENKIVIISGRLDFRDGAPKIICEEIQEIIEP
jgi:DNA polymerase III alpha subunit/intein/homing endonuclease